jgi:hypothetical protein
MAVTAAVLGIGALIEFSSGHHVQLASAHSGAENYAVSIGTGIVIAVVSIVAQATIIIRVVSLLRGQPITNSRALAMALAKSPQLIVFALAGYVVRFVIRSILRKSFFGAIFGAGVGAAWEIATFFAVPVIVLENAGPFAAVRRSLTLCRQRWGEEVVGKGAFGLIVLLGLGILTVIGAVLGFLFAPLGLAVAALGLVALLVVTTVAAAAFQAALYLFATTGRPPAGYTPDDLMAAFGPRRRGRTFA